MRVQAAITPTAIKLEGVDAVLMKAMGELDVGGRGSAVLVVGSSEPILNAATAAEMFTARYHPPNGVREGVIQTFTVRGIDEVSVGKHGEFDTLYFLEGALGFMAFVAAILYSTQLLLKTFSGECCLSCSVFHVQTTPTKVARCDGTVILPRCTRPTL